MMILHSEVGVEETPKKRPTSMWIWNGLLLVGLVSSLAWNWTLRARVRSLESAAAQEGEPGNGQPDEQPTPALACNPRPTDVDEWIRSKNGGCLDRKWFCRNAPLKSWIRGGARDPSILLGIRQGDLVTIHLLSVSYMELMKEAGCSFAEVHFMNPDDGLGSLSKDLPPMPSDVDEDIKAANAERERKIKDLQDRLNKSTQPSKKVKPAEPNDDSIL